MYRLCKVSLAWCSGTRSLHFWGFPPPGHPFVMFFPPFSGTPPSDAFSPLLGHPFWGFLPLFLGHPFWGFHPFSGTPFLRLWDTPSLALLWSACCVCWHEARLRREGYPPIARYGVLGVSTWPIGCDTPSPFSEHVPLGEHAKWRSDTTHERGISAILARYHTETRQKGCDTPSAILSRKGIAWYGGVSRIGPLSLCIALKTHRERSSREVAGKLRGEFGEVLGSAGSFQKLWGSLTPSLRLAESISNY